MKLICDVTEQLRSKCHSLMNTVLFVRMSDLFGLRKTGKFKIHPKHYSQQNLNYYCFLTHSIPTFDFIGFSVEMSVPSALCLLESNTFLLFLFVDVLQTLACLA